MSTKNKSIIKEKSSKKVADFLDKTKLHKKDFAQMVGVTLSYVYNLIDENIPFSTRGTTLERIAVVMDILPEDFAEYIIQEEPIPFNKNLQKIKDAIKDMGLSTVEFLKMFERKKRPYLVDMLRGVKPIPINPKELAIIGDILNMGKDEIFTLWRDEMVSYLDLGGFNPLQNKELLIEMFKNAKTVF